MRQNNTFNISNICKQYVTSLSNIKRKMYAHKLKQASDKDLKFCAAFDKAYEDSPLNEKELINAYLFDCKRKTYSSLATFQKALKEYEDVS